ncbi:MAG: translation elongation factor Ts [Minisyncoccia bacterium]|jgi:elongation factor Ts
MDISTDAVKELRDKTGVSVMECKKALVAAGGDMQKALAVLGERSVVIAAKKQDRALGAGIVAAYVHNTAQVGALVLLNCETDFVSKNEEFIALAHDIAMQISAMNPANHDELMQQQFIKDPSKTIANLISGAVQKFGERIELGGFSRRSVV